MAYNLALRLTGERAEAEDLSQDALVRAVKAWPSFRGESEPGTWLYRIVVNAWKNRLRDRAVRRADSLDALEREPAGAEPGPDGAAERGDERERLEKALARLAPEERAVLVLRELDGRSYSEIAAALDLPLGTVKSRLARAREQLAVLLVPEEKKDAA